MAYGASGPWIGDTAGNSREIIAGVPTKVMLRYDVNSDYKITKTYPKVVLTINNKTIEFRNVPGSQ